MDRMNRKSSNWLVVEQKLKEAKFNYCKLLNKITLKTLDSSIYNSIRPVINGSSFSIRLLSNEYFLKQMLFDTLNLLLFELLIIKLNNRTYSVISLQHIYLLEYKKTKLLFYKFNLTHFKTCFKFSK